MLDKDLTHCAILSLLAISAILLLWHIKQMGAKPTTAKVGMVAARIQSGLGVLPQKEGFGVGGSMLPARLQSGLGVVPQEKFGMLGGNPLMPARMTSGVSIAPHLDMPDLGLQARTIGGRIATQPVIQSVINKDNVGVTSAHIFGMRK
jgi:hypothetical protein